MPSSFNNCRENKKGSFNYLIKDRENEKWSFHYLIKVQQNGDLNKGILLAPYLITTLVNKTLKPALIVW